MKAFLLVLAVSLTTGIMVSQAQQPPINAVKAAELAQADIESRGLHHEVFVAQVTYKGEMFGMGKAHWEILWSKAFKAQTEGRLEYGLRIEMDGSYKRSIK